jgi:2-keto-3-deoxy-L-rhamnonate aldolase RhmA
MGASGLVIPHALNAPSVMDTVRSVLYKNGTRGFSNSPRAGHYGALSMNELIASADPSLTLIFQIEDQEAVENIEDLCAIDRVDAYLIGRADLAVSLGVFDIHHAAVDQAIERVALSCKWHQKALGIFITEAQEAKKWMDWGVSFFIIGSDQSMLLKQAKSNAAHFQTIT